MMVLEIAGVVRDGAVMPPTPIVGAWVGLEDTAGETLGTTRTTENGEFTKLGKISPASLLDAMRRVGAGPE